MSTKYSSQWKIETMKQTGKFFVTEQNKTVVFKFDGEHLLISLNKRTFYTVKNMLDTLSNLAEEKDFFEVAISNPDSHSRSVVYMTNMRFSPALW